MAEPVDDWTLQKLAILRRYLCTFTVAWKDRAFSTAYIDAFAGADYRVDDGESPLLAGFPDLADASSKAFLRHSTRTALSTEPPFDGYVFIERDRQRCHVLEALAHEWAHLNIQIRRIDANRELRRISRLNWQMRRAVLFVDAYAANLEWETITAVSRTNAIGMWLLLPVGIGCHQLAGRAMPLPPHWRDRLNVLFKTDEWLKNFEARRLPPDRLVEHLGRHVTSTLKSAFATVSSTRVMRSRSGAPLYLLCFATSAPGVEGRTAVEEAHHLLEESSRS